MIYFWGSVLNISFASFSWYIYVGHILEDNINLQLFHILISKHTQVLGCLATLLRNVKDRKNANI